MARSRYFDPSTGNEIEERVLDNILPARKRNTGMAAKKKGQTFPTESHQFYAPFKSYDIYKDRDTNQLFISYQYEGQKYEPVLTNPSPSIDKTGLYMLISVRPLFYSLSSATIQLSGAGEEIVGTSGSRLYGYKTFTLTKSKAAIPVNYNTYGGFGEIAPVPRYVAVKLNGSVSYYAISSFDGTTIQLINPILLARKITEFTLSVNVGNFIYANAAVVYDQKTILIGTNSGIYKGVLDSEKNVVKVDLEVPSGGSWSPMSFQLLRTDEQDKSKGCLYMTAQLCAYMQQIYTTNTPGWRFSNFTVKGGDFGQNPQLVNKFGGVVGIFKFDLEVSKLKQDTYSVIYSHIGGYADQDFQKEEEFFWGKMSAYQNYYREPKIYDDQNLHTVKMKSISPAGGTPSDLPEGLNTSAMLSDFNFGVDSLIYKYETNWLSGLFFKKTERPYLEVFDKNGNKVRNILIVGDGYPVDALKLRWVGVTQKTKKLPTEPLGEGDLYGAELNVDPVVSCVGGKCKFIRGDFQKTQYGHYMFGVKDSTGFLLKTWDSYPFYTGYYFNRNMYTQLGGDANWGACDVDYASIGMCGEVDYCYTPTMRYNGVQRITTPGIMVSAGGLFVGLRFPLSYYAKVCCGSSMSPEPMMALGWQVGTNMSYSDGCEDQIITSGASYTFRRLSYKKEPFYFLDSLTSNHFNFKIQTILDGRVIDGAKYEKLKSGQMEGKLYTDKRWFAAYTQPRMYISNNPVVTPGSGSINIAVRAIDTWELHQYWDWVINTDTAECRPTKTFSISSDPESSPSFFKTLYGFNRVSLVERLYIVGAGDKSTPLRDFLESLDDEKGKALDARRYDEDFLFNASLDWAIYSPVGMSDIFPQDRAKYKGKQQLSGKTIFEGYTVNSRTVTFLDTKAKTLYGGSADIPTDYKVMEVVSNVSFLFTSLTDTLGGVRAGPHLFLNDDSPVYTKEGTITERYILIK